ncbi:hypothetical protein BC828DRAFT_375481 [Blastocladiella britannica]|nr:hypothetical protein BC828DRAFT_375481 [Blastocladiella britannica]
MVNDRSNRSMLGSLRVHPSLVVTATQTRCREYRSQMSSFSCDGSLVSNSVRGTKALVCWPFVSLIRTIGLRFPFSALPGEEVHLHLHFHFHFHFHGHDHDQTGERMRGQQSCWKQDRLPQWW